MTDENPTLKLGAGIFSVEYMGKNAAKILLAIVVILAVLGIVFEDKLRTTYSRWIKSEYFIQYDNLKSQHKFVRDVADQWDNIEDINNLDNNNVQNVRAGLFDALERYEVLKTDKLDIASQVVWLWHLAKLKVIEADISDDYNAITRAITYLKQAQKRSTDPDKLKPYDIEFLTVNKYNSKIRRTMLNAYAMAYFIQGVDSDRQKAMVLLKIEGGCEQLKKSSLYHKKIISALGC